jgi:hypothetical protein
MNAPSHPHPIPHGEHPMCDFCRSGAVYEVRTRACQKHRQTLVEIQRVHHERNGHPNPQEAAELDVAKWRIRRPRP